MVLSMEQWRGKVAIVTGASRGIGRVIARELVKLGILVVGIARRKEPMDALANELIDCPGRLYPLKADLTSECEILNAFAWIKDHVGPVSILINNAAHLAIGSLLNGETEEWSKTINTGILGLSIATREAVKDMRANNVDGHIIHIGGLNGHFSFKMFELGMSNASKTALTALTETLRQELNNIGSKIKVTSISPALVETDILERVVVCSGPTMTNLPKLKPEDIADAVIYILSTPAHVQVHELMIRPTADPIY